MVIGFDPISLGAALVTSVAGEGAGLAAAGASAVGPVASAGTLLGGTSLATAASLAGTAISGIGAIGSARASSAAAGYNAKVAANNAAIATQNSQFAGAEGEQNVAVSAAKTRANVGATLASEGASGVDISSGSFGNVRESEDKLGTLNTMNLRSEAARQAYGFETQSASYTGQAALDKAQKQSDQIGGYLNAGATVLGGVGKASQYTNWLNQGSL